jgi:hypothetical protein
MLSFKTTNVKDCPQIATQVKSALGHLNVTLVCKDMLDKRNSTRKSVIEWEETDQWPHFLWLFGLPVICQLCIEYYRIWKGKQKFVFNLGHFFEGPMIHGTYVPNLLPTSPEPDDDPI